MRKHPLNPSNQRHPNSNEKRLRNGFVMIYNCHSECKVVQLYTRCIYVLFFSNPVEQ
jgi:hypothetical protein